MKSLLVVVWQRRWCRVLGVGLVLCVLPLLHPFIRQSAFGPQIDGIPWCVWEDDFRRQAQRDQNSPSWFMKALEKLGLHQRREVGVFPGDFDFDALLPLYLHLVEDRDVEVRRRALRCLIEGTLPLRRPDVTLAVFQRHLDDRDGQCRLTASWGVWAIAGDTQVKTVLLHLLQDPDLAVRSDAAHHLKQVAATAPDLFQPMAKLAEDADPELRRAGVESMQHFGNRGVPILRKSMRDPDKYVPRIAIDAASKLGKDGSELIPDLLALQNHPNANLRDAVAHGLYRMDPKTFAKPANQVD